MTTNAPSASPDPAGASATINLINPDLLKAALWYGGHGFAVFPLHKPKIDHQGQCVGCTCEHYKRSEIYRKELESRGRGHDFNPEYKCPQPGKCPAVNWRSRSTMDEGQIRKWWEHPWRAGAVAFTPNIGIDCGKSGVLVLDADAYKDTYAGEHLLSLEDQQTVTSISGGGGQHLYFHRGAAEYGNATGNLPAGIDIRGEGGYIVAPPSLHHSGRPYQWEIGYGPHEFSLQPLPESLRAVLEAAHQQKRHRTAISVTFGSVDAGATNLEQWDLPASIIELIHNPAPPGQRSEQDMKVVVALCAAGAGNDEVLAVFSHYPIGAHGKFAEKGPYGQDYLAVTLTNARAYLAEQEQARQTTLTTIDHLHLWLRTHAFVEYISAELRKAVYRTDSTDTKVADAVCDLFALRGSLTIHTGKKTLARYAGVSPNTVIAALHRLHGWLYQVTFKPDGLVISLAEGFVSRTLTPLQTESLIGGQSTPNELDPVNEYSPRKATDPFLTGTSRTVKERCREAAVVAGGTLKEWLATVPAGLGETCLRVLDALQRCGEMTVVEIAAATGKTLGGVRRACRRLEVEELVESTREHSRAPKVYALVPDVWQQVEALAPTLRTHLLGAERADRQLRDSQRWVLTQQAEAAKAGDQERVKELDKQLLRLGNQRLKYLGQIYADRNFTLGELARLAFDVQLPRSPHPSVLAKLKRFHGEARLQVAEAKQVEQEELTNTARTLRQEGMSKKAVARSLQFAGYTLKQAWQAVHEVWRTTNQPIPIAGS